MKKGLCVDEGGLFVCAPFPLAWRAVELGLE